MVGPLQFSFFFPLAAITCGEKKSDTLNHFILKRKHFFSGFIRANFVSLDGSHSSSGGGNTPVSSAHWRQKSASRTKEIWVRWRGFTSAGYHNG